MNIKRIKGIIERIGIDFQINEPFYGAIFRRLKKVYQYEIKTAGLTFTRRGLELRINPDFISRLSYKEIKTIFEHILLHISLRHLSKIRKIDNYSRELFNISADLEVNQMIDNIPKKALSIENVFSKQNVRIEKNRDAGYYYTHLSRAVKLESMETLDNHDFWPGNHEIKKETIGEGELDDVSETGDADIDQSSGEQDNLNGKNSEDSEYEDSGEGSGDFSGIPPENGTEETDSSHDIVPEQEELTMEIGDGIDESTFNNQDLYVDFLLNNAEEEASGELPGNLSGSSIRKFHIDEENISFNQNWYKILRDYLNNILYKISLRHYEIKRSIRRPNKKLGFPFPSIKIEPLPRLNVAICIDGSGSIDNRTFQEFMHEVNSLYDREFQITMLGFDSEVKDDNIIRDYNPYIWMNARRVENLFQGELGGGTDFTPPIVAASNLRPKPDCIVMFTDSYDNDKLKQPDIPIIFVLSQKRDDFYDWANCINMF